MYELKALARNIEQHGHLTTGFVGTPYLLHVLTRIGRLDLAYRLLLRREFPSWLFPVVKGGATTIWERWDGWTEEKGFFDPEMNSFNHYAYGAVGDWLYGTLAGLDLDPEVISGFAFGLGIDRIAMMRHGIDDLRLLVENDVRFLNQFPI